MSTLCVAVLTLTNIIGKRGIFHLSQACYCSLEINNFQHKDNFIEFQIRLDLDEIFVLNKYLSDLFTFLCNEQAIKSINCLAKHITSTFFLGGNLKHIEYIHFYLKKRKKKPLETAQ